MIQEPLHVTKASHAPYREAPRNNNMAGMREKPSCLIVCSSHSRGKLEIPSKSNTTANDPMDIGAI